MTTKPIVVTRKVAASSNSRRTNLRVVTMDTQRYNAVKPVGIISRAIVNNITN